MELECNCISGLVVEYIVAIDVTRARFPADARGKLLLEGSAINGSLACLPASLPLLLLRMNLVPTTLQDTLAEWLRRRPAKPMGSPCVGSNPTGVDLLLCPP